MPSEPPVAPAFELRRAFGSETRSVLALLPELAAGEALLPPAFLVAHLCGEPARLLGAAAFEPRLLPVLEPGFRGLLRVLPAWRRRGIGRALLAALRDEVAAWQVPRLLSWRPEPEGGDAVAFQRACGGRVGPVVHRFLGAAGTTLPACRRIVGTLAERGRVPHAWRLEPLGARPLEPVAVLHAGAFDAAPAAALALMQHDLQDELTRRLSVALWDEAGGCAGYLLAGPARAGAEGAAPEAAVEVRFWAAAPGRRHGMVAALLLERFITRLVEAGLEHAVYECQSLARAPLNVAMRSGALALGRRVGFVWDTAAAGRAAPR